MIQKLILLFILIFQSASFELRTNQQGFDVLLTYQNEMIYSQNEIFIKVLWSAARSAKFTKFILLSFDEFDMSDKLFSVTCQQKLQVEPPTIKYTSDSSYMTSFNATLANLINPTTSGQKTVEISLLNGGQIISIYLIIEIKDFDMKAIISGKGVTFERSNIQLSFEFDFYNLLKKPILFQDFQIQLEFPIFTSYYISCSDFIGLSRYQFCKSKGNTIYVYNKDSEFFYNESKHSFMIHNFSFPSNLEIYTANLRIFEKQKKLAEDQFTFNAYAPSQIERIVQISSNCYATQQTMLKLFLDSQKYILSKSDLQITLSQMIIINQIIINDINQSFVQNNQVIQIFEFNDQQLDQFKVKVEFSFFNLEYKQNVVFSFQINKISPSLSGNFIYAIQPNEYKNFIVTRDTEIVNEDTNLYINIELQNPIINGEIHIQFPQELNLIPSQVQNLNGQYFQFTFRIKNPSTICQTNRFESQAYQNNQFREQLYKDVILIQKPNQMIQVQQISLSNDFTSSISNLQLSLQSKFGIYIQFEDSIKLNQITCQNCLQLDSTTIKLLKSADVIKGIETPRLAKESNLIIKTYENECQTSQVEYKLLFQPNKFKIVPELITKELNQLNQWLFSFELPCEIIESDKLKILYPSSLLMNESLKCQILHINKNQFDCSNKIINLPSIQKNQVIHIIISQPRNPIKPVLIEWQFILLDKYENQMAIFTSQFEDWEYQIIQISNINLIDYRFMEMKEALLRISLQYNVDQILYDGNIIIFCENCQQQSNQSVIITQEGQNFLEIPFRFFTIKNQYVYQFSYKLITFYQGNIQQKGTFKQTISLTCSDMCRECESYEKCTICQIGYQYNFSCINECPINYYGLNNQCYPCSIGQCTKCIYLDQEICLECNSDLDLYLNQCVSQDYFINENTTNQTNNNETQQNVNQIQVDQVLKVKYNFPGILLFIFLICLFTLIIKIQNYSSISKTILFSLFSVLENGIGIFIFINFLIFQLYDLAFLSLSLLIYQIILQLNCLLQLKTYLIFDLKYQKYKKDHLSIKIVFLISCGLNYIFFIIQTSRLNENPQWNCKWQYKKEILRQIANSLRQSLVYSILQITIVITSMLELQQVQTTFLEILSVNIINIGLNFYHQYQYNSSNKRVQLIE